MEHRVGRGTHPLDLRVAACGFKEHQQLGRAACASTRGVAATAGRHSPGRPPTYDARQRERILAEARRAPVPAQDGTATWSLSTLQRALRRAPDGLPRVSTYTIWEVLRQAGYRFGRTRSWCPTGRARRKRKSGVVVEVIDPDAVAKKN